MKLKERWLVKVVSGSTLALQYSLLDGPLSLHEVLQANFWKSMLLLPMLKSALMLTISGVTT